MITIRRNVFETNSSSTHSLTIVDYIKPRMDKIPRHEDLYVIEEYGDNECEVYSEAEKVSFLLNVIASYIDRKFDKCSFEEMVKLQPFVWLKELIENETGTKIEFKKPYTEYFPYYEEVYEENDYVEAIFDCNWEDENEFKEYMKKLIFNNEKGISYEEDEW